MPIDQINETIKRNTATEKIKTGFIKNSRIISVLRIYEYFLVTYHLHKLLATGIGKHFMAWTSGVAITAGVACLLVIYCMAYHELDKGLGFASIGIITFFGVAVSSSIFEEHRHNHGSENPNTVFVGKDVPEEVRNRIKDARFAPLKDTIENYKRVLTEGNAEQIGNAWQKIQEEYDKETPYTIVNPKDPTKDDDGNFLYGVIAGTGS